MIAKPSNPRAERLKLEKAVDDALFAYLKVKTGFYCHLRGSGCKCGGPLQPNHLITRANKRLRWDEENVVVACAGHNTWAHFNQTDWNELWRSLWPNKAKNLDLKRQGTMHTSIPTLRLLLHDYELKLRDLELDKMSEAF